MKKFIAVILSSTMIFTAGTSVYANDINITEALKIQANELNIVKDKGDILRSNNIPNVLVDGKELKLNEGELLYENNNYIPIRELAETLGLKLDYISEGKIVVLDNGKIQLPVDSNKASVNGKIVSLDETNSKVCTLIVADKSYIPVNFVNNVLGYKVEYNQDLKTSEQQQTGVTKLDKTQALEVYNSISKQSQNIKNATVDMGGVINFIMSDGTDSLDMGMTMTGTTMMNMVDKVDMYSKQSVVVNLMGETQTVNQEMFYKDGKMYINQNSPGINEFKYKMDLNLEEAVKMSSVIDTNQLFNKEIVLGGTVQTLQNGNKQYNFDLDMDKAFDIFKQFGKEFNLTEEDFQALGDIKMENTKLTMEVDNDFNPINYNIVFDMNFVAEGITIKANVDMDMNYKNVGTTKVTIPNEDLSKYQDINDIPVEETTSNNI